MRSALLSLCLILSTTCSWAIPANQGTGVGCIRASDGTAGPVCSAPKKGFCCDESQTYGNCEPAAGQSCTTPLTPFCCDEMDLPGCYSAADPNGCVGDHNPFCCARSGTVTQLIHGVTHPGGLDCLITGDKGCSSRPVTFCC